MKHYTYDCGFGEVYEDCYFSVGKYPNGNLKVQLISESQGPIVTITTNLDKKLDDGCIYVKNYSENKGVDEFLYSLGMIERRAKGVEFSGFVVIPVYELTDVGKEILGLE